MSDRGDRLADWLARMGLAEQLSAAGLPTFVRGEDGRARWTDPRTGQPLDDDQLEQLDRLLHEEGAEPEHAVPVQLVQLAREARVREELLREPSYTYERLALRRGATLEGTRFAVHKAASDHRLLVVAEQGRTLVPAFQLDGAGELRPELAAALQALLASRMDPWRVWAWLTRPAALLGGEVPERAASHPGTADVVLHAAVRLAERVSGPPR